MTTEPLSCSNFFSCYVLRPWSRDLSQKDRIIASLASFILALATLGLCHVVCYAHFHRRAIVTLPPPQEFRTYSPPPLPPPVEEERPATSPRIPTPLPLPDPTPIEKQQDSVDQMLEQVRPALKQMQILAETVAPFLETTSEEEDRFAERSLLVSTVALFSLAPLSTVAGGAAGWHLCRRLQPQPQSGAKIVNVVEATFLIVGAVAALVSCMPSGRGFSLGKPIILLLPVLAAMLLSRIAYRHHRSGN